MIKVATRHVISGKRYGDTLLISDKGSALVGVSDKKRDWYLKRDLACDVTKKFHDEGKFLDFPLVLQLRFKSKVDVQNNAFYFQPLVSRCVVCGKTESLSTHHVIPQVIRKHFEEEEKSHAHSWCVLLCEEHHLEADKLALTVHESSLKVLDRQIQEETKRLRREWALKLIQEQGGLSGIKVLYREQFLQTNPQFLPSGFLEDQRKVLTSPETKV